jgi:hypothetical protein
LAKDYQSYGSQVKPDATIDLHFGENKCEATIFEGVGSYIYRNKNGKRKLFKMSKHTEFRCVADTKEEIDFCRKMGMKEIGPKPKKDKK